MPGHDIIVIGASAGGIEALTKLFAELPPDLPAAIFVVLHIPAQSVSTLPAIFSRAGHLPAFHGLEKATIEYGHIYIAPPDHHLLVEQGYMRVVRGPRENRHRPAVDPLFRSAARAYGKRVVGVVLTGSLDDGTAGLLALKRRGGVAIVQDPKDALYRSMPQNAIENVAVDYVLPLDDIPRLLVHLSHQEVEEETTPVSKELDKETRIAEMDKDAMHDYQHPGVPSVFSCPECGGVLWELQEDGLLRFRCRVGHAFSSESYMAAQVEAVEDALWAALKTLEETASLNHRLSEQARERNQTFLLKRFSEREQAALRRAEIIRQVLEKDDASNADVEMHSFELPLTEQSG